MARATSSGRFVHNLSTYSGFVLGISFQGLPLDEVVQLPPAPPASQLLLAF